MKMTWMKAKKIKLMKINNRFGFISFLMVMAGLVFASPSAHAHRVGIPVTTLEWHAPSNMWHMVHRLSVHDFAEAIDGLDTDGLETPEAQALIGRYVIDHFVMVGQTDALEISYLGAEEDADSFFVYFQLSSPDQMIEIKNELAVPGARDDRRHAMVNIANGKDTATLLFTADDGVKVLALKRPATE